MRHNAARLETDPLRARDIQLMIERFEKKKRRQFHGHMRYDACQND